LTYNWGSSRIAYATSRRSVSSVETSTFSWILSKRMYRSQSSLARSTFKRSSHPVISSQPSRRRSSSSRTILVSESSSMPYSWARSSNLWSSS
jgi:hypothetical protein